MWRAAVVEREAESQVEGVEEMDVEDPQTGAFVVTSRERHLLSSSVLGPWN